MSKTELKIVESGDQTAALVQELERAGEHTEELPPVSVAVGSFDSRIAGLELCSIAHELAKHRSSMAAFYVQEEQKRRNTRTSLRSPMKKKRKGLKRQCTTV